MRVPAKFMNNSETGKQNSETASDAPKHRRRPRYAGTHPRRFSEKYKELHPELYPETVQKVMASGKTPAGTHRPICVREIIEVLQPRPGQSVVDATLGYGGHASELLKQILPGGRLIGLDRDPVEMEKTRARLVAAGFPAEVFETVHSNFAGLPAVLAQRGLSGVDMVLADLGCSSMQYDNPDRGFSYKLDGPLDMRMNPAKGFPASALLNKLSEAKLAALFEDNADEPEAARVAAAIVRQRASKPLASTTDLAEIVRQALASLVKYRNKEEMDACLKRVFQAVRIAINDEFSALDTFLRGLPSCLNPGGRVAILTFHSGEDRRVKRAFEAGVQEGAYLQIAREVIRASAEEVRFNPRASSAKLRWAIASR